MIKKGAIDRYSNHAPKVEWIRSFYQLQERFFDEHELGSNMFASFMRFLRDAGMIDNDRNITPLGKLLAKLGVYSEATWGIMFVNLCYSSEMLWFIKNVPVNEAIPCQQLSLMLQSDGERVLSSRNILDAYRKILQLPFGTMLGLGFVCDVDGKPAIFRKPWLVPDADVLLYSLYRYTEGKEDFFPFSLDELMQESSENAVSPAQIFALTREDLARLLSKLSAARPEFVTYDFETIALNEGKTSADVLKLFEEM